MHGLSFREISFLVQRSLGVQDAIGFENLEDSNGLIDRRFLFSITCKHGEGKYIESHDSPIKPIVFVPGQMKNMAIPTDKII